ncbi:MAG: SPOR domain-containing protein [Alphaproteobacteria bacterium]
MAQPVHDYEDYEERDPGFELVGEQRDDEPASGSRRLVAIVLTLAVVALFVGGLWFAYVQGTRHAAGSAQSADSVPLLRADERPAKVKPDQPGGMPVPDQNSSLYNDKLARSSVEKLLPPPEQPLPRPAPLSPVRPAAPAPTLTPPSETGAAAAGPPPGVPTAPPSPAQAPPQPAVSPPAMPAVQKPTTTASTERTPETAAKTVEVRLGSLRSPEEAREEWQRLKRANGDLLGNLKANAVSVDLGEKGIWYRILAGPLDQVGAERLCAEKKQRNHGCVVAR